MGAACPARAQLKTRALPLQRSSAQGRARHAVFRMVETCSSHFQTSEISGYCCSQNATIVLRSDREASKLHPALDGLDGVLERAREDTPANGPEHKSE